MQFALSEKKKGAGGTRISRASPAFASSKGSYSWRRNAMMVGPHFSKGCESVGSQDAAW